MAKGQRITKSIVDRLKPGETVWDSEIRGFGARRQRRDVSFVLYKTINGKRRLLTIGTHGAPWTVEQARKQAIALLGSIVQGTDPAAARDTRKRAPTVAELCDDYLRDAASVLVTRRGTIKKESTLKTDRGRIKRHIKPLLGDLRVTDVKRSDVETFMQQVAAGATATDIRTGPRGRARVTGGKGAATRTVGLLGAIMTYAIKRGLRTDNPVAGITRYADGRRERRLTASEYRRLQLAIDDAEANGTNPMALAGIRLLALTGARRGDIVGLRWSEIDVDGSCLRLADTKSGTSVRPLGRPALVLLRSLPNIRNKHGFVFPNAKGTGAYTGMDKVFKRIRKAADLKGVAQHTLRHTFASVAAECGYGEPTIAAMLGQSSGSITSRYIHHLDQALVAAADTVAGRIAEQMAGRGGSCTVP